jgi:hypothetical protein
VADAGEVDGAGGVEGFLRLKSRCLTAQHPSLATDGYQLAHAPFLSAVSGLILLF